MNLFSKKLNFMISEQETKRISSDFTNHHLNLRNNLRNNRLHLSKNQRHYCYVTMQGRL